MGLEKENRGVRSLKERPQPYSSGSGPWTIATRGRKSLLFQQGGVKTNKKRLYKSSRKPFAGQTGEGSKGRRSAEEEEKECRGLYAPQARNKKEDLAKKAAGLQS